MSSTPDPKLTEVKVLSPCPGCGNRPPEDTVWIYQQKFYCSQECVVRATGGRYQ